MFARLLHILHNWIFTLRDRQRERYLAASTDLADLEHRMRRVEFDPLHQWPPGAGGPVAREYGSRNAEY
jgi:hypothetical protein